MMGRETKIRKQEKHQARSFELVISFKRTLAPGELWWSQQTEIGWSRKLLLPAIWSTLQQTNITAEKKRYKNSHTKDKIMCVMSSQRYWSHAEHSD